MKKILFVLGLAFIFSSCNKCKECSRDGYEYTSWNNNGSYESHGNVIEEICSDNFESKADFNDYIEAIEDEGWECKSDFWN
tara:strand:- start:93 stop:335 length:243 start_codon:yes stop_codon:yes gene_type:complete